MYRGFVSSIRAARHLNEHWQADVGSIDHRDRGTRHKAGTGSAGCKRRRPRQSRSTVPDGLVRADAPGGSPVRRLVELHGPRLHAAQRTAARARLLGEAGGRQSAEATASPRTASWRPAGVDAGRNPAEEGPFPPEASRPAAAAEAHGKAAASGSASTGQRSQAALRGRSSLLAQQVPQASQKTARRPRRHPDRVGQGHRLRERALPGLRCQGPSRGHRTQLRAIPSRGRRRAGESRERPPQ